MRRKCFVPPQEPPDICHNPMFKFKKHSYSEDMFADSRMSFGDHLEDLRTHLWLAISGFVLIMVGVFVLDGIGLITSWHYPFTRWQFGIGRPMLDFITAPVEDQLIEFHERKVQKMLVELEGDEKLKAANRSKSFRMSIPQGMLDGSQSEKSLVSPLPGDGQPIPYGDLIGRSQYQADAAAEALQQKKWKDLKSLAESLQETSQRFEIATKVPENTQPELRMWAEQVAGEARN